MVDSLPFPRITETTPEKQVAELVNYLIQFKETLEFVLMNISTENLSPELVNKLNEMGADIEKSNKAREEELAQITVGTLTISDVVESNAFSEAVKDVMSRSMKFNVNLETGHLEYNIS
jgi:hypothetical protein